MDKHVHKSQTKSLLLYHLVFLTRYRKEVFTPEVETSLQDICREIEQKHEIRCIEIGFEEDLVHMLVQGIPTMPVTRIVTLLKSLTEREIFKRHPKIKKEILSGEALWKSGYCANTVDLSARKDTIFKQI